MPFNDEINELSSSIPPGLDPRQFPIIAAHFFGLVALPSLDATGSDNNAVNIDEVAS